MKISNKILGAIAIVLSCAAASAVTGYVTLEHQRIILSTVDSSPIGSSAPSTGSFTTLTSSGTAQLGNTYTASLNTTGGLIAGSGATITGTTTSTQFQGPLSGNVSGNVTGAIGDFSQNVSSGSFNGGPFVGSTGSFSGNVSALSFSGPLTGVVTGSLVGNASTATSLAATPGQCSSSVMVGIQANGSPICSLHGYSIPMNTGPSCATGSGSYNTCSTTVTFSGFSDGSTNYAVTCIGTGSSDPRAQILGVSNFQATSFVVTIVTEGSVSVSYAGLSCTATHG